MTGLGLRKAKGQQGRVGELGSLLPQSSQSLLVPRRTHEELTSLRLSVCCCLKRKEEIDGAEFPRPWRNENRV